MATWADIKTFTLQKLFAITGDTLVENTSTLPYIKSMPQVANEALQILSTAGKFIIKSYEITQDGEDTGVVQRYNFKTLVDDFYSFHSAYFEDDETYKKVTIKSEMNSILILASKDAGTWTVYYNAYPQTITKDTLDATELALDPEIVVLLPLYMASQLYKDDDIALATQWRNEFEVARETLSPNADAGTVEFVTAEYVDILKGW